MKNEKNDIRWGADDIMYLPDASEGSPKEGLPKLVLGPGDRTADNNITTDGKEKIMNYMHKVYVGTLEINVSELARAVGCQWNTAYHLKREFLQTKRTYQTTTEEALVLGIGYITQTIEDIGAHPERYGFEDKKEETLYSIGLNDKRLSMMKQLGPTQGPDRPSYPISLDFKKELLENHKALVARMEADIQEEEAQDQEVLPAATTVQPEEVKKDTAVVDTKPDEPATPPPAANTNKVIVEEPRHFTF